MSKTTYAPMKNAVGQRDRGKKAHDSKGEGNAKMRLGKPHCVADRKGRFKGEGSDLRDKGRAFKSGSYSLAGPVDGGGAGHSKQPKGHTSLAKGGSFKK